MNSQDTTLGPDWTSQLGHQENGCTVHPGSPTGEADLGEMSQSHVFEVPVGHAGEADQWTTGYVGSSPGERSGVRSPQSQ